MDIRNCRHGMLSRPISLFLITVLTTTFLLDNSTTAQQHEDPKSESAKHTNALADESSPYLLLHAHNPVNWYPWNEVTLALAKKQNKPIFLSIGYSSCHWCHVMERESFLDEEIAGFLNQHFICIKVDREERPDVDQIYMEALMTYNRLAGDRQGGGWPLSMFLLPDGRPFFGGTYFPARTGDRGRGIGFLQLSQRVNQLVTEQRANVEKDAEIITKVTRDSLRGRPPLVGAKVRPEWIKQTLAELTREFDPVYGGFGFSEKNAQRPKFPEASKLMFLVDQVRRKPDDTAIKNMLITTCEWMMMGGIHDSIGGGFHRYSVDRFWRIPHYEKMLYDNGQLATVYAEAFATTGREDFKEVVEGILSFVDRELTAENGGFYSSLDAESEGKEGKFYVWNLDEIKSVLTDEEYDLFAAVYGLNESPNFEGEFYAPQLSEPLSVHAKKLKLKRKELESRLKPIRQKLFTLRSKRIRPALDHKILTSWNGMMIRGYADAGRILENEQYLNTAKRAAEFALQELSNADGRLYRTHTAGTAKLNAYLIDYASLIDGLLAIHRATDEPRWVMAAAALQKTQNELFWDEQNGAYFYTSADHETLLVRSKRTIDNAIPAGNSISAGNLLYFSGHLDGDSDRELYREKARRTVLAASPLLDEYPLAAPRLLNTAAGLK